MKQKVLHIGTGNMSLAAATLALLHSERVVIVDAQAPGVGTIKPEPPEIHPAIVNTQADAYFKKQVKIRGIVPNIPTPVFHEGMNRKERREELKRMEKEQKKK